MLDCEKTRQREVLLARLRGLYAEIAEDEKFQRKCKERMDGLRGRGKTVMLVGVVTAAPVKPPWTNVAVATRLAALDGVPVAVDVLPVMGVLVPTRS